MKTLGIVGGIGPESTIVYYRTIVDLYKRETGVFPSILINSIDVNRVFGFLEAKHEKGLVAYLGREIDRLAAARADFVVIAANTPHVVFGELSDQSRIPLLSIITSTCEAAKKLKHRRLSLFGTRFVMESRLYSTALNERAIELVMPSESDQEFIHEKYQDELLKNVFLSSTREGCLRIIERLKRNYDIDGLIFGGTELHCS